MAMRWPIPLIVALALVSAVTLTITYTYQFYAPDIVGSAVPYTASGASNGYLAGGMGYIFIYVNGTYPNPYLMTWNPGPNPAISTSGPSYPFPAVIYMPNPVNATIQVPNSRCSSGYDYILTYYYPAYGIVVVKYALCGQFDYAFVGYPIQGHPGYYTTLTGVDPCNQAWSYIVAAPDPFGYYPDVLHSYSVSSSGITFTFDLVQQLTTGVQCYRGDKTLTYSFSAPSIYGLKTWPFVYSYGGIQFALYQPIWFYVGATGSYSVNATYIPSWS
ncbi:hypothetical protein TTSV1_gp31 [Thermoproteus tenax spherical virus 1]|uniref:Uncharacterized protein n=1 Tax=Thermoproteus tenax spherical virus 1 TaxID=292639 RepID=Q647D1_9VIRU|nr:hypothetical protein TTSV1_gp31 [Thermoproteus tenax spherical virus 1]AAU25981.1 hypothetical protein [Thermoproteus tenax spherical virus 1]